MESHADWFNLDMAKYAEVKEKQRNVDAVKEKEEPFSRGVWVGFTYKPRNGAQDNGGVSVRIWQVGSLM